MAGWHVGPRSRRLFRGVYADSDLTIDHRRRCIGAALLLPADAAITGRSAAWLYGAPFGADGDPVEIACPPGVSFGPVQGMLISRLRNRSGSTRRLGRLPVTDPLSTARALAARCRPSEALVYLDRLARLGVVDRSELERFGAELAGRRGGRRLRIVAALIDPLAGLPMPVSQFEIRIDGVFVARADLAWPERRVAVEYDGHWHGSPEQLHADRRRLNRLQAAGWLVIHVTSTRLRADFPALLAELKAALRIRRPL